MTNPIEMANALKLVVAAITGVQDAHLGAQAALSRSPAAEILLEDGALTQLPAGGPGQTLDRHTFVVLFLVAMTPNNAADEATIGHLVTALINTVNDIGFDDTLGGLTERTRATSYAFGMTSRNKRAYRSGAVRIESGEL